MSNVPLENVQLVIDAEDSYKEMTDVFYSHPSRIPLLRFVTKSSFASCSIKNTSVESLSSLNLVTILEKLRPNGTVEVIINQPITVMQEYDAKQIEANAKLAGFDEIKINETTYVNEQTQKKLETLAVTFMKPLKNPNAIDIVVKIPVKEQKKETTSKKVKKVEPGKNVKKR